MVNNDVPAGIFAHLVSQQFFGKFFLLDLLGGVMSDNALGNVFTKGYSREDSANTASNGYPKLASLKTKDFC